MHRMTDVYAFLNRVKKPQEILIRWQVHVSLFKRIEI